ncbi:negative regulator of sigma E activity [Stenotrophomonas sp. PvP093]|uniref:sigma-E factor negative regulatory protein n=1 Tax=Stenotrophomonas TaxID=40323 RepID=UPI0007B2FF7A|nr:sigma-E factor negative regulatory protein [Stenotrophomonas sp. PvP093]KZE42806.1 anti-sigma factor [Stenotrophomonas maltophilia]MBP2481425.1 negative regulator of sigma E activity [Stenotrophomonas sp. PvP093]MCF3544483.1 anti-sigma factor [Stenotrophomonas maltophilia]TNX92708.1 anti-sigma factor [Stenotrophomonas maltophilia]TPD73443.1 anti-sigma factor [Stenotrophomonas maltophilia]
MTSNPFNESQNHQSPAGQRLDQRHREQLSALVDGELGADEARFLLRRMEHDPELAGCQERWQLLGDVMRGQAPALAPAGFSAAVAAAIAAEPTPQAEPRRQVRRSGWRAWGGGAALAASVAAVALFIGGEKLKEATPGEPQAPQVIASQAELAPAAPTPVTEASVDTAAVAVAAAPAVAMAAAGRRQDARRASATRSQQAARAAQRDDTSQRAIAAVQAPLTPTVPANANRNLPFGEVSGLQARPWPRSSLAPAAGGALNASFPSHAGSAAFYPFEPRLQDDLPVPPRPRD